MDLATFTREKTKEATIETERVPESTKTKHTVPIKHSPNTTQKINSNITQVKAQLLNTSQPELSARYMEKQQTQKETHITIQYNTTAQPKNSAQKMEMLNNHTSKRILQSESPNITQNKLNVITQNNVNTAETTRLATSMEDEKMNVSATKESTLNQNVTIPMPYCKLPSDLGQ